MGIDCYNCGNGRGQATLNGYCERCFDEVFAPRMLDQLRGDHDGDTAT
jgi:hypothetical protein